MSEPTNPFDELGAIDFTDERDFAPDAFFDVLAVARADDDAAVPAPTLVDATTLASVIHGEVSSALNRLHDDLLDEGDSQEAWEDAAESLAAALDALVVRALDGRRVAPTPADDEPKRDAHGFTDDEHDRLSDLTERVITLVRRESQAEIAKLIESRDGWKQIAQRCDAGTVRIDEGTLDWWLASLRSGNNVILGHAEAHGLADEIERLRAGVSPQPEITRQQIEDAAAERVLRWTDESQVITPRGLAREIADAVWALLADGATSRDDEQRRADLLTQVEERRTDAEFMDRLAASIERNRPILDRLADGATPAGPEATDGE